MTWDHSVALVPYSMGLLRHSQPWSGTASLLLHVQAQHHVSEEYENTSRQRTQRMKKLRSLRVPCMDSTAKPIICRRQAGLKRRYSFLSLM
jgi:hypothetical protein